MPGPSTAGTLIYAKDIELMSAFYQTLLGMQRLHADSVHVVLEQAPAQLIIHAIPAEIARSIEISTPPTPRESTAIKPFFTLPGSLTDARSSAEALHGHVFPQEWPGPGFIACNAMDPEGNLFQVRQNNT